MKNAVNWKKQHLLSEIEFLKNTHRGLLHQIDEEMKFKEEEINRLNNVKETMEENLKKELQDLETAKEEERLEMTKLLNDHRKDIHELKSKIDIEEQQRDMGIQILKQELRNTISKQERAIQKQEITTVKDTISQYINAELQKLKKEKEHKKQEIHDEKTKVKHLKAEVNSLTKEIEAKNKELEAKDVIFDQQSELLKFQSKIESEKQKHTEEIMKLEQENEILKQQIAEIKDQVSLSKTEEERAEKENYLKKLTEQQKTLQSSFEEKQKEERFQLLLKCNTVIFTKFPFYAQLTN